MTEPLTRNRVNIKAILADPLLREELIEGATDFICKVEGIRRSPQAQAVLDAAFSAYWSAEQEAPNDAHVIAAAALRAAADQVGKWESAEELRAIAAELEGADG